MEDQYQEHADWTGALTLACQAAHAMRTGEDADFFEVDTFLGVDPEDYSEVEKMLQQAWTKLLAFFKTSWGPAATQALADALIKHRELDFDDIKATLNQVAGGSRAEARKALQLVHEDASEKTGAPVTRQSKG